MCNKKEKAIHVPIMEEDVLLNIIYSILTELQRFDFIYISNGSEGLDVSETIINIFDKLGILRNRELKK